MITGDAKETAVSIAKELNIIPENADIKSTCFTGAEFEELTQKQKESALSGSDGTLVSEQCKIICNTQSFQCEVR